MLTPHLVRVEEDGKNLSRQEDWEIRRVYLHMQGQLRKLLREMEKVLWHIGLKKEIKWQQEEVRGKK